MDQNNLNNNEQTTSQSTSVTSTPETSQPVVQPTIATPVAPQPNPIQPEVVDPEKQTSENVTQVSTEQLNNIGEANIAADNAVEESTVVEEKKPKDSSGINKALLIEVIVLAIAVVGLIGYIVYDKVIANSNNESMLTEKTTSVSSNGKTDNTKTAKLLDNELTIAKICTNTSGVCNKEVGKFTLAGTEHTLKVNIDMDDLNNEKLYTQLGNSEIALKNSEKANVIIIDSKRIPIGFNYKFDKIVKIGDNYLAIGVDETIDTGYEIRIYNSNLNLVKTYHSIHVPKEVARDEKMAKNYLEYFKVESESFTRYLCNTSKDTGDGKNQMLEKYKVTITNGNFTENKVSEVNEYCSAQD